MLKCIMVPPILLLAVFLLSIVLTRLWISLQERQKRGQPIRDYGPDIHTHKQGIPTAGGLPFLTVFFIVWGGWMATAGAVDAQVLFVAGATLGFVLIGILDDGLKFFQQHARGLPVRYKLLLQFIVCAMLGWWTWGQLPALKLPFLGDAIMLSPTLALILLVLVFISTVNAFNETDGLDGLLGGVTLIALAAYGIILWLQNELTLLSGVILAVAALVGFLWWNAYPARIIMGDTGSFALGALVAALALMTGTALWLPLIALIPVLESLSVILQVASFKLLKKRVFKIAPLHHHFERVQGVNYEFFLPNQEWPEILITVRFWIIATMGTLLGLLAYR